MAFDGLCFNLHLFSNTKALNLAEMMPIPAPATTSGTQWRLFMTLHIPALVIVKKVAAFKRVLFYLNVDRVIDKNHLSNKNSLGFKQKQPRV